MGDTKHIRLISRGSPLLAMAGQTRKGVCIGSVNVLKQCLAYEFLVEKTEIRVCKNTMKKDLCRSTTLKC